MSGAMSYLVDDCGLDAEDGTHIKHIEVPGHMELITGAKIALKKYKPCAVLCIGVLIKGESDLYEAHCAALSNGLSHLAATQDVPIIQSLLMCKDEKQAEARALGENNPGRAYAMAAIDMITLSLDEEHVTP